MIYHSEYPYSKQAYYDNQDRHVGASLIQVCDTCAGGSKGVFWNRRSPLHNDLYNKIKSMKGRWSGIYWQLPSKSQLNLFCTYAEEELGAIVVAFGEDILKNARGAIEIWAIGNDTWVYDLGRLPISNFSDALADHKDDMAGDRIFSPQDGSYVCWIGSRQKARIVAKTFSLRPRRVPRDIGRRFEFEQNGHDISFYHIDPRKNPLHGHLLLIALQSSNCNYTCEPEKMVLPLAERALSQAPAWSRPTFNNLDYLLPPASISVPPEDVPGFCRPCPVGHILHEFQREGVNFVVAKGGRALIADEMGLGKTAQAIVTAQVLGAKKVLVICPSGLTRSWRREILDWTGETALILHRDSTAPQLAEHRWFVVGYDLLVRQTTTWKVDNREEKERLLLYLIKCLDDAYPADDSDDNKYDENSWKSKYEYDLYCVQNRRAETNSIVKIGEVFPVPYFYTADPEKVKRWESLARQMTRQANFVSAVESLGVDFLTIDEAHRMKNAEAKRTSQVLTLTSHAANVLLLTGTPVRNHIQDLDTLLTAVFGDKISIGDYHKTEQIELAKLYLDQVMIRRRKEEVLPQLPLKIRQEYVVELELTKQDIRDINKIVEDYNKADSEIAWLAVVSRARHLIGLIKAKSKGTKDVLKTILEEKNSAVVYAHHIDVAEAIAKVIATLGYTVDVISGDVATKERDLIVHEFQRKIIDVVVATIATGGEGITLHRTDTAVFLEFHWVPAAMWQAEDRIHRIGQQAESCNIVYVPGTADEWRADESDKNADLKQKLLKLDMIIQEVLTRKLKLINEIHDENNIIFPTDNSAQAEVMASLPCPSSLKNNKNKHSEYVREWRMNTGRTRHKREDWLHQHNTEQSKPWISQGISRATWFRRKTKQSGVNFG